MYLMFCFLQQDFFCDVQKTSEIDMIGPTKVAEAMIFARIIVTLSDFNRIGSLRRLLQDTHVRQCRRELKNFQIQRNPKKPI